VTVCSGVFDIEAGNMDEAIDDAFAQADYDVEEIEDEDTDEADDDELDDEDEEEGDDDEDE
jgi:ribonuclease E